MLDNSQMAVGSSLSSTEHYVEPFGPAATFFPDVNAPLSAGLLSTDGSEAPALTLGDCFFDPAQFVLDPMLMSANLNAGAENYTSTMGSTPGGSAPLFEQQEQPSGR